MNTLTTKELVQTSLIRKSTVLDKLEHIKRLKKVSKRDNLCNFNINKMLKRMNASETNFLLVDSSFVQKFQFAASIKQYNYDPPVITNNEGVVYSGDLPDFVLDNIQTVEKELGLKYLTIHSNMEFPTILAPCDPVLIGWFSNPKIYLYKRPISQNQTFGVIVAVWDMEKELEII